MQEGIPQLDLCNRKNKWRCFDALMLLSSQQEQEEHWAWKKSASVVP